MNETIRAQERSTSRIDTAASEERIERDKTGEKGVGGGGTERIRENRKNFLPCAGGAGPRSAPERNLEGLALARSDFSSAGVTQSLEDSRDGVM